MQFAVVLFNFQFLVAKFVILLFHFRKSFAEFALRSVDCFLSAQLCKWMISNKFYLNLSKSNLMIIPPQKILPEKCSLPNDMHITIISKPCHVNKIQVKLANLIVTLLFTRMKQKKRTLLLRRCSCHHQQCKERQYKPDKKRI